MTEQEQRKKPGPRKQYGDRTDVHLQVPKEDLEYIDSVTLNRTQWLLQAIKEKRERETEGRSTC